VVQGRRYPRPASVPPVRANLAISAPRTRVDVDALHGQDVIIRIEPGDLRAWDYADEYGTA